MVDYLGGNPDIETGDKALKTQEFLRLLFTQIYRLLQGKVAQNSTAEIHPPPGSRINRQFIGEVGYHVITGLSSAPLLIRTVVEGE